MRRPSLSVDHSCPTCARQNSYSLKVSTRDLHVSATALKKRSPAGDRRYLRRRDTSALKSRKSLGPENADNESSFVRFNCTLANGQPGCSSQPNGRLLNRLLDASSLHLAEPRCVWQMKRLPPPHTDEKSRPLAEHYQGKFRPEYRGSGSTIFGNCRLTSSASLSRSTST